MEIPFTLVLRKSTYSMLLLLLMLIKSQKRKYIYGKVLHNFVKQSYNNNEHTINKSYQDKNKPGYLMSYKTSKVNGGFFSIFCSL